MQRRSFLSLTAVAVVAAVAALAAATAPSAFAQGYPSKPVRIVVPFPPGGAVDFYARIVQPVLTEKLGQPIIVENRPGASGMIGAEFVAKSPPDGYTLLVVSIAHAVNPALYKLPYDSLKAFAPVALFGSSPNALAVHPVGVQAVEPTAGRGIPHRLAEVVGAIEPCCGGRHCGVPDRRGIRFCGTHAGVRE